MSNKLSPLFNSTSALLEFQIWSDVTSHAIPVKSCATTGKNQFELATASLNHVLPTWNGSTRWPPLVPLIFPPDDLYGKNTWLRTMCCLQNEPITYFPLLTKHCPRCSKIENYTSTHTIHLYFTDNFLWSFYLFSQSQQSLTKCNLFCFVPKLSLSFFNCSCSPMNVKMEQKGQS